jgi:hypothetical protein
VARDANRPPSFRVYLAFKSCEGSFHQFAQCDAMGELSSLIAKAFAFDESVKAVVCALRDTGVQQHCPA